MLEGARQTALQSVLSMYIDPNRDDGIPERGLGSHSFACLGVS